MKTIPDYLMKRLIQSEGYKQFVYFDTLGVPTIGIGLNLKSRGIKRDEAIYIATNCLLEAQDQLREKFDFYDGMDEVRQGVLMEMCFNIGIKGLFTFSKLIDCLRNKDYEGAANNMEQSTWARQVGHRATELAWVMREGK